MKRILLVDDDTRIQQLLKLEFEDEGYHVLLASNGKEALSILVNTLEKPDLVILDLRMPKMSGFDAFIYMSKINTKMPVVIYTAYGSYKNDQSLKAAHAYIVKSSDISELKKKVRELL